MTPASVARAAEERFRECSRHRGFRWGVVSFVLGAIGSALVAWQDGPIPRAWEIVTNGMDDRGHPIRPVPRDFAESCANLFAVQTGIAFSLLVGATLFLACVIVFADAWRRWARDEGGHRARLAGAFLLGGCGVLTAAWTVLMVLATMFP